MFQNSLNNQLAITNWLNNTNASQSACAFRTNSVIFANSAQLEHSTHTWIIYSGAKHHITPHLSLFTDLEPVTSGLHLPNGNIAVVSHIGTIRLTADICPQDVLVVPQFQ